MNKHSSGLWPVLSARLDADEVGIIDCFNYILGILNYIKSEEDHFSARVHLKEVAPAYFL